MADISIDFLGICTHIWNMSAANGAPAFRRTVCVAARTTTMLPYQGVLVPIAPHIPQFIVAAADIIGDVPPFFPAPVNGIYSWNLDGVTFDVLNGIGSLSKSSDWPEMANLGTLTPGIGPINPAVVEQENSALSSMHFNSPAGLFVATRTDKNAVVSTLTVSSADELFGIRITPYGSQPATLILNSGAAITIVNDADGDDTDYDFLLHYECVTPFPVTAAIPPPNGFPDLALAKPTYTWPPIFTVGPGCSNSTYP